MYIESIFYHKVSFIFILFNTYQYYIYQVFGMNGLIIAFVVVFVDRLQPLKLSLVSAFSQLRMTMVSS